MGEPSSNAHPSVAAQIEDFERLHVSNANVSHFVSVKLSGARNYLLWKAQMCCLLESNNMCGIVDGTCDVTSDDARKPMKQYDSLVKGWIFGSVTEDVLVDVFDLDTAKEVWEKLKSIYDPEDSTRRNVDAETKAKEMDDLSAEENTIEEGTNLEEVTVNVPTETKIESEDAHNIENKSQKMKDLRAATIRGSWPEVESILNKDRGLVMEALSRDGSRVLHIAVGMGHNDIVKKLIPYNRYQIFKRRESDGITPLHIAAIVGNKGAAELLIQMDYIVLKVKDNKGLEPLQKAYDSMHLDTVEYLLEATHSLKIEFKPREEIFVDLLVNAIYAKEYRLASQLVERFPTYASKSDDVLMALAKTFPSGLENGETLIYPSLDNLLELVSTTAVFTLILFFLPIINLYYHFREERYKEELPNSTWTDHLSTWTDLGGTILFSVVYMLASPFYFIWLLILVVCLLFLFLYSLWWKYAKIILGPIKHIERKKKEWDQAKKFLEQVCNEIDKLEYSGANHPVYTRPIMEAVSQNAFKVVDEILFRSPESIQSTDERGYSIIQLAILNRYEKIYNLMYDIEERKNMYRSYKDSSGNNILHLAGRLAPLSVLNRNAGAVLQLQRELQWYEEVKKFVIPKNVVQQNIFKETPNMVFTREHENLVKEGEKWMKTTAESCSITAALIITIVFAAAITVPGGNHQENGTPLFKKEIPFIIFYIADAISLFASSTALLVFLSILTTRFAEKDFLVSLPRRLFIGIFSLILSTTMMMVAFSATLFLVFGEGKQWKLAPICGLAFIPIAFFIGLQFPLMVDLFSSTYIPIFGYNQRKSILRRLVPFDDTFDYESKTKLRFNPDEIRLIFGKKTEGYHRRASMREKKMNNNQNEQLSTAQTKNYARL